MTIHIVNGIKVRTSSCILTDWSAIDDDTYDGEGCEIGRGATEQEAIDSDEPGLDTPAARDTLADAIQQCIEDEIEFMRAVMEKAI